MPSPQPPHLLTTPKLTLERERDVFGQEWTSGSSPGQCSPTNPHAPSWNHRPTTSGACSSSSAVSSHLPPSILDTITTANANATSATDPSLVQPLSTTFHSLPSPEICIGSSLVSSPRPDQSLHPSTPTPRRRQRTLSSQSRSRHTPSVQLALANPTLSRSIASSPAQSRTGTESDQQAHAKQNFELNVRRYYYQLVIGCQHQDCTNRLCRSSSYAPKMTKDAAAILAVQLAARPRLFFCPFCPLDPILPTPESPLPSTTHSRPHPLATHGVSQCFQDAATRPTLVSRKNTLKGCHPKTTSSKSSPRPGTSVDDFVRGKDTKLYEPNDYSKSMPSFTVSQLLSPTSTSHSSSLLELPHKDEDHTSSSSSTPERQGTPLFRTLLSVSPFSNIFSPRRVQKFKTSQSQEIPRARPHSPTQKLQKSVSTDKLPERRGRPPWEATVPTSTPRTLAGGLRPPLCPRSFSPSRSDAAVDANQNNALPDETSPRTAHALQPKSDPGSKGRARSLAPASPTFAPLTEERVGLGYATRQIHSQQALDLSRYYYAPTLKQNSCRKGDPRLTHRSDSRWRPLFGSAKDPDSDGVSSASSTDDEAASDRHRLWSSEYKGSPSDQHSYFGSTEHSKWPSRSTSEGEVGSKTHCAFTKSTSRRGSDSSEASLSSVESEASHWCLPGANSVASRRSSTASEDMDVALPYLNLTLLRQAIATYNSSRPKGYIRQGEFDLGVKPANATKAEDDHRSASVPHSPVMTKDGSALLEPASENSSLPLQEKGNAKSDQEMLVHQEHLDLLTHQLGGERYELETGLVNNSWASPIASIHVCDSDGDSENPVPLTGLRSTSPAPSIESSDSHAGEGDSTFLLDSLRSVFSSASALGSSFAIRDREKQGQTGASEDLEAMVDVGGIDLEVLRECYEMMIELRPRTIFAIQVTNSMEILLARLELEHSTSSQNWHENEMRAVIILLMNPFLFEQPYQESLLRRILRIFIALPNPDLLAQWLSCMDEEGMAQLVTLFKMYLSNHFTPKPLSVDHPAICAVKSLAILYHANNIRTHREQTKQCLLARDATGKKDVDNVTISFRYFYSGVMEAVKFKEEYQIWSEGWGKTEQEKQFSYFDYPFLLSPTSKSHIINLDALAQMSAHYEDACIRHALADHAQRLLPDTMTAHSREFQKGIRAQSSPYLVLELTRAHLVQEAFDQIVRKHADLKKPLKVAFVDVGEEGMDQGGVTKEFFQLMVEKVFDSQFGLFKELEEGRSWWFEGMLDGSSHVEMSEKDERIRLVEYELVGILVGLALYNGVILGVRFPSVVYRKLLRWEIDLDTFTESFPALGNGLEQMLAWSEGDVYDIFMRNFEISYEHLENVTTLPLMEGGEDIPVTNNNREDYVKAYMDHYVHEHVRKEFDAFQAGFEKVCGGEALKLLRPEELELLLCGNSDLDMHDLEASCLYDDGYSPSHGLIKDFWDIVHHELTAEQHKKLLVFVTGSDRVPIRGLKDLMFVIQRNGPDSDRLPTALTCFSRLLLPEYLSRDKVKERLVTAIENSNGFGLV